MRKGTIGALVLSTLVLSTLIGCGSGEGPQEALDAFAKAVNDRDDRAVRELVCQASRAEGGNSLADPFAGSPYDIDRIDSRLRGLHYVAKAGDVTEQGDDRATGKLSITAEGLPTDLSAQARQVLDAQTAPFPVGLTGEDDTVGLVKEDGRWRVCDQLEVAGDETPAPATAALQLRPVVAERTPRITEAPGTGTDAAAGTGTDAAGLEALADAGCGGLPAAADPATDRPLVTCSSSGDTVYSLGPAEVSGEDIVQVSVDFEPGNLSSWAVNLDASGSGSTRIAELTRRLSTQATPQNQLAVVVDGLVVSAPAVLEPIIGGKVQLTGNFDRATAEDLVARITGRSPSPSR